MKKKENKRKRIIRERFEAAELITALTVEMTRGIKGEGKTKKEKEKKSI